MKIFKKYLNFLSVILSFGLSIIPLTTLAGGIDEIQVEKLGNFLDNAFANMTDEEKDLFMQEVQREQEKLMAMTPEERAAREEQVARELDQLMNNSPYGEWFEKPVPATLPEPIPPIEESPKVVTPKASKSENKPKPVTISKDLKEQYKQLVQKIVQAIDALLLKTNNMQHVQHPSWNEGKWHHLKRELQSLKSQLQMVINSDQTLADFTSNDQKDLRQAVEIFEKVITERASQVKTPDAMGLVATFEDELKILDQARYDAAVLQLKALIDSLSQELNQTKLVSKIQKLLEKHAPTGQLKPIDSTKLTKKNSTKRITPVTVCESNPDQKIVLKEAQVLAKEIKRCANRQLLDLALQYQDSPTTTLKRKLQWKLSELELHMHKLAKNVELIGDCRDQVDLILNEVLQNNALVTELITVLNQINATHELKDLIKQINHHSLIIRF